MKYIKFTYVDTITNIGVNVHPAVNGPKFPEIKGLEFRWDKLSKHPTQIPEFFGICGDDADTSTSGVLNVISKEQYDSEYSQEQALQRIGPQTVTAKQIRLRLLELNLLDVVTYEVSLLPQELQIEWNYGTELNKQSDLITALSNSAKISESTLNKIFMSDEDYQEQKQAQQRIESEQA